MNISLHQEGQHTARGPHPACEGSILALKGLFDMNLASKTQIKLLPAPGLQGVKTKT